MHMGVNRAPHLWTPTLGHDVVPMHMGVNRAESRISDCRLQSCRPRPVAFLAAFFRATDNLSPPGAFSAALTPQS